MHPRTWLIFKGLHGVVFQMVELFMTTGVKTSSPTQVPVEIRLGSSRRQVRSVAVFINLITTSFVFRIFSKAVCFHA
jgi:hypothetical protein